MDNRINFKGKKASLGSESGNAHKVRARHGLIVRYAQVLVQNGDFPLRWGQTRKNHEAEWFPHTKTVPAALLDLDHADKRVTGIDQIESHDCIRFWPQIRALSVSSLA